MTPSEAEYILNELIQNESIKGSTMNY